MCCRMDERIALVKEEVGLHVALSPDRALTGHSQDTDMTLTRHLQDTNRTLAGH